MAVDVSVIITVWNGADTIARAIESALAQDYDGFEVIAIDDGSTDGSGAALERYRDRVRLLHRKRGGIGAARNEAIRYARGDFLAFLDADDLWVPEKLTRTVGPLKRDSEYTLAYSNATVINMDGQPVGAFVRPGLAHAPTLKEMLGRYWPIVESMVVIRRSVYDASGGFCEESRVPRAAGAYYVWLRAREIGPFRYIPDHLVSYQTLPYPGYIEKNAESSQVLARLIQERYGEAASLVLKKAARRGKRQQHRHYLSHMGLMAMREGRRDEARRLFVRALKYGPLNMKNALRLCRTFLPARLARSLTGRTRS
ncbi:MAG: glycosyltransferase family 2 protein [Candidatus Binataceae bacterium]